MSNTTKQIIARLASTTVVKAGTTKHPEVYEVLWSAQHVYGQPIDQGYNSDGPFGSFKADGGTNVVISDTAKGIEIEVTTDKGGKTATLATITGGSVQELLKGIKAEKDKQVKSALGDLEDALA